mmetsp:Transcript_118336/g.335615  ORF Transcript_118336/g.335615 Transcript_118336/m.335615 type:complete len:135 (+) Transcript_118336:116-520(+)
MAPLGSLGKVALCVLLLSEPASGLGFPIRWWTEDPAPGASSMLQRVAAASGEGRPLAVKPLRPFGGKGTGLEGAPNSSTPLVERPGAGRAQLVATAQDTALEDPGDVNEGGSTFDVTLKSQLLQVGAHVANGAH